LAGETEVLGENLPECRFVHYKPHMPCPDANPGLRGGKPATNRLSYDTAITSTISVFNGFKLLLLLLLLLLPLLLSPLAFFPSELISRQSVGLLGRVISPVARPLPTHRTQTQEKRGPTSMPRVGFKPTIPVFEQAKTVQVLDRAATVINRVLSHVTNIHITY
jgi:hypothetical protein